MSKKPKGIQVAVADVWATLHLDTGDITTTVVDRVEINGSMCTFYLTRPLIPFGGFLTSTTLRLGNVAVKTPVDKPVHVLMGDTVTSIQRVQTIGLSHYES